MNKKKGLKEIIILLITIVISVNFYLSSKMEGNIKQNLNLYKENNSENINMRYEDIKANFLFKKAEVRGLSIIDSREGVSVNGESLVVRASYKDLLRGVREKELTEINKIAVVMKGMTISNLTDGTKISFSNISFSSVGRFMLEELQTNPENAFERQQGQFSFRFNNLKVELGEEAKESLANNSGVLFMGLDIENIMINEGVMEYRLNNNKLDLKEFKLDSPLFSFEMEGDIDIDFEDGNNTMVRDLVVKIKEPSPTVKLLIGFSGIQVPKNDETITLKINGNINDPNVEVVK